ncbi:MAG: nucleotidyltransferase family protein [Candidatus Marinimicrobia bacterium]|nr:nucleotidyltransferase family protein [Candidatus Neomarinimicrobiota bacterium]
MNKLQLIITAAGLSRRQPPNKLLLPLDDKTVIETTVENFIETVMDIIVVTGHQREQIEPPLAQRFCDRITIVHNPDYETGLASSIKAGLKNNPGAPNYWCFCNGDKPFIKPSTIEFLLTELEQQKPQILVPTYQDQPGHPTFFSSKFTSELLALTGETGARDISQRHGRDVLFVPVADEGVALDMDRYLVSLVKHKISDSS